MASLVDALQRPTTKTGNPREAVKALKLGMITSGFVVIRIVATSQMHPTHARKTFPCFDEPALKAVFYITLIHPPGTVALSNGLEQGLFSPPLVRWTL